VSHERNRGVGPKVIYTQPKHNSKGGQSKRSKEGMDDTKTAPRPLAGSLARTLMYGRRAAWMDITFQRGSIMACCCSGHDAFS